MVAPANRLTEPKFTAAQTLFRRSAEPDLDGVATTRQRRTIPKTSWQEERAIHVARPPPCSPFSVVQWSTSFRSPCRPCRPCRRRVAWLEPSSPASPRPLPPWLPADRPPTRHLA